MEMPNFKIQISNKGWRRFSINPGHAPNTQFMTARSASTLDTWILKFDILGALGKAIWFQSL
jgi:hypothetical protein